MTARRADCAGSGRLDGALFHAAAHDGGFEQVAAMLGVDATLRHLAHLMSRATDALQTARHRAGRLDEQHQIDGAHVDAELETRSRDDSANPPRLQRLLDLAPLLVRDAAVVREQDLLARQFVESLAQPLAKPPRIHEQDRRPMRQHLFAATPDASPATTPTKDPPPRASRNSKEVPGSCCQVVWGRA